MSDSGCHNSVLCALLALTVACGAADSHDDSGEGDTVDNESEREAEEGGVSSDIIPCRFDTYYLANSDKQFIAEDADQPECLFSMGFAERDPETDALLGVISEGDEIDVHERTGFWVASLEFTCNTNSSGRCTADRGKITVEKFEPTFEDVAERNLSGRAVWISIDAEGTKPGQKSRYVGRFEGRIP